MMYVYKAKKSQSLAPFVKWGPEKLFLPGQWSSKESILRVEKTIIHKKSLGSWDTQNSKHRDSHKNWCRNSECIWSLHKLKADLNETPKKSPTEDVLIIKNYKPYKKNPHETKLKVRANWRIHTVKTGNNWTVLKGN